MYSNRSAHVQQLHSPQGVIGPLTLLINVHHLVLVSKSLQTRVLKITIYQRVSDFISARKLSEALLGGLAMVELIRTSTQVAKMISTDNFNRFWDWAMGSGWNQYQYICDTFSNRDIFNVHSIQFMIDFPKHLFRQAFSTVKWTRWEGGRHKRKVESCAAGNVYMTRDAAVVMFHECHFYCIETLHCV